MVDKEAWTHEHHLLEVGQRKVPLGLVSDIPPQICEGGTLLTAMAKIDSLIHGAQEACQQLEVFRQGKMIHQSCYVPLHRLLIFLQNIALLVGGQKILFLQLHFELTAIIVVHKIVIVQWLVLLLDRVLNRLSILLWLLWHVDFHGLLLCMLSDIKRFLLFLTAKDKILLLDHLLVFINLLLQHFDLLLQVVLLLLHVLDLVGFAAYSILSAILYISALLLALTHKRVAYYGSSISLLLIDLECVVRLLANVFSIDNAIISCLRRSKYLITT